MNRSKRFVPVCIAALVLLAGCEDASVEGGMEAQISAVSQAAEERCGAGVTPATEGQSFCSATGERIDLINGMIAPFPVRAIRCPTAAALLGNVLLAVLPAAAAHGGHLDAPVGVVDVAEPAGSEWSLRRMPLTAGRYCGVELILEQIPPRTFTAGIPEPHDDVLVYARPCHYPNPPPAPPEHDHQCYAVTVRGAARSVELDFPEPVAVHAGERALRVELGVDFGTWFDGIDFEHLETDAVQQQALLDNIVQSLSIGRAEARP